MSHDNPRLIGDFTPRPLSSTFLDLMGKPPSGILQASMQKEKRPLLLILQPRSVTQNCCSHFIGWCPSWMGWRNVIRCKEENCTGELFTAGSRSSSSRMRKDMWTGASACFWRAAVSFSAYSENGLWPPAPPPPKPKLTNDSSPNSLFYRWKNPKAKSINNLPKTTTASLNLPKQQLIGSRTTPKTASGRGHNSRHSKRLQTLRNQLSAFRFNLERKKEVMGRGLFPAGFKSQMEVGNW